jgi:hypothetical protein
MRAIPPIVRPSSWQKVNQKVLNREPGGRRSVPGSHHACVTSAFGTLACRLVRISRKPPKLQQKLSASDNATAATGVTH